MTAIPEERQSGIDWLKTSQYVLQALIVLIMAGVIRTGIDLRDEVKRHGTIMERIEPLLNHTTTRQGDNSTRISVVESRVNSLEQRMTTVERGLMTSRDKEADGGM